MLQITTAMDVSWAIFLKHILYIKHRRINGRGTLAYYLGVIHIPLMHAQRAARYTLNTAINPEELSLTLKCITIIAGGEEEDLHSDRYLGAQNRSLLCSGFCAQLSHMRELWSCLAETFSIVGITECDFSRSGTLLFSIQGDFPTGTGLPRENWQEKAHCGNK